MSSSQCPDRPAFESQRGFFSPEKKWLEREADHLPISVPRLRMREATSRLPLCLHSVMLIESRGDYNQYFYLQAVLCEHDSGWAGEGNADCLTEGKSVIGFEGLTLTYHQRESDAIVDLIRWVHFLWNMKHKHPERYPVRNIHEADSCNSSQRKSMGLCH
jgi:hypothetical protein